MKASLRDSESLKEAFTDLKSAWVLLEAALGNWTARVRFTVGKAASG